MFTLGTGFFIRATQLFPRKLSAIDVAATVLAFTRMPAEYYCSQLLQAIALSTK